jgi:hypothetical protein
MQVLTGYALASLVTGYVVLATPDAALSNIFFPLSMIFAFWTAAVMLALNRETQAFKDSGDKDGGPHGP